MITCRICGRDIRQTNFIVTINDKIKNHSICDKCYKANNLKVVIKDKNNKEYDVEEIG